MNEPSSTDHPMRSFDLVRAELDRKLEAQARRSSAFDTRGVVLLATAGAIVGLSPNAVSIAQIIGLVLAGGGGGAAWWSLAPRVSGAIDPRAVRERYLNREPDETKLRLLDTTIVVYEIDEKRLSSKGRRLMLSAVLIFAGIAATITGAILDYL